MRVLACLLLVVAVLLAGCGAPPGLERDQPRGDGSGGGSGGGTTPDPGDLPELERPERTPMLLAFSVEGCTGVETVLELDVAGAQAALPEGYTVLESTGAAGGPVATAQYAWTHCRGLSTPSSTVNDTVFGFVAVRVEAPEDAADADEHWYRFRVLAQDDLLAALWRAADYDAHVGVFVDEGQAPDSPLSGVVDDHDVRLGEYGVRGVASAESSGSVVRVAHYTQTAGGRLEWVGAYDAAVVRAFVGDFAAAGDDPLAATQTQGGVTQRYLVDAAWSGTDLWLRAT